MVEPNKLKHHFKIVWTDTGHKIYIQNLGYGPWNEGDMRYPFVLWGEYKDSKLKRYYYDVKGIRIND
jgi:hypothetical protein